MVMTVAVLALLAIMATAFLTRARTSRVTAVAIQRTTLRADGSELIARALAAEIAGALFARPIDGDVGDEGDVRVVASANQRRLPAPCDARRYSVDQRHPYNFAPYHVVASTNWPDALTAPNEGNPPGEPGTGDTRWLRDSEPMRHDADRDGRPDSLRFWRHLTNVARVGNGFRVCRDISDVTDADGDGVGGLVLDLGIPHEQWLGAVEPAAGHFAPSTGDADAGVSITDVDGNGHSDFVDAWQAWLGPSYADRFLDPAAIPPNFYHLKDLDADGTPLEPGERPRDEFAGRGAEAAFGALGSPRWNVGRVLADSDGDGFTDSFWFLSPHPVADGVRQLVAVSIVDNSAMFNANVATRFVPGGVVSGPRGPEPAGTCGETPADLALAGARRAYDDPAAAGNVGFGDAPHQREHAFDRPPGYRAGVPLPLYGPGAQIQWRGVDGGGRWADLLEAIGVRGHPGDGFPNELLTRSERRRFWLASGSRPFDPAPGLTPFTLADELELRLHHGQNHPWLLSRFERAMNTDSPFGAFLRSGRGFEESTPYLDQLDNPELLHDHRRKLTLFNGARNDELPPWLHWRGSLPEDVVGDAAREAAFLELARRRLDLRDPGPQLRERLPSTLLLALADGDAYGGRGYFGPYGLDGADRLRRLAASFSANIFEYRDRDARATLDDAVALPAWGRLPRDETTRYLGIERQPFLVEAFIGHVYEAREIPGDPEAGIPGWTNSGRRVLVATDERGRSLQSTVVVIQIANPFHEPIDLADDRFTYEIELFGQTPLSLNDVAREMGITSLPSARHDRPFTMVLYAIDERLGAAPHFGARWRDFLDIEPPDHAEGVILADVSTRWSTRRAIYDAPPADHAVRLVRVEHDEPALGGESRRVVIDRFDEPGATGAASFGASVGRLAADRPPSWVELTAAGVPAPSLQPDDAHPDRNWTPTADEHTHWAQWVRASRAWGRDHRAGGGTSPRRVNPRYVFATKTITTSGNSTLDPRPDYRNRVFSAAGLAPGTSFTLGRAPDGDPGDLGQPWITRDHLRPDGVTIANGKPTFFDRVDKGFHHSPYAMQMLQKDHDFQQVGEILNVWLWGHELEFDAPGRLIGTSRTFSEAMAAHQRTRDGDRFANRPPPHPEPDRGATLGIADPDDLTDPRHAVPQLPATARVLDAFVCDGPGLAGDAGDRFDNAMGFTGRATPGLVNISNAPVEVLRALPHWYRLVPAAPHVVDAPNWPRSALAESVVSYRERFDNATGGFRHGPDYADRPASVRGGRGLASIGELLLLERPGLEILRDTQLGDVVPEAWTSTFAAADPFDQLAAGSPGADLGTDVNGPRVDEALGDGVAGDTEKSNLLVSGASNLVTTRSDVFTVYFRIRSFRPNPVTGVWDATDPEHIEADARYVMLVDRSRVERPADPPRILFLEKITN